MHHFKNGSDDRALNRKSELRRSYRKRDGSVRKSHSKENPTDAHARLPLGKEATHSHSRESPLDFRETERNHRSKESYLEAPQKENHAERLNSNKESPHRSKDTESFNFRRESLIENGHSRRDSHIENQHSRRESHIENGRRDSHIENHQNRRESQIEKAHSRRDSHIENQHSNRNSRIEHEHNRQESRIENYRRESNKENPHHRKEHVISRDDHAKEALTVDHLSPLQTAREPPLLLRDAPGGKGKRSSQHRRISHQQELDGGPRQEGRGGQAPTRGTDLLDKNTSSTVKQDLLHMSLERQALQAEREELSRVVSERENIILELRQQVQQRDRTIQAQRVHLDDAIRLAQNGKRVGVRGESPGGRGGGGQREELQLVRDAIVSLRGNFRETDPSQHTLDTLEQAIAVLIERGTGGGGSGSSCDKSPRGANDKRTHMNGSGEAWTKVIYFTERTVTPFMSSVGRRLGEVRLRDFKAMFDRPGSFRFHFKSYDPEYGMVKEEIVNDDDILPGVDGKIIAWVEDDAE